MNRPAMIMTMAAAVLGGALDACHKGGDGGGEGGDDKAPQPIAAITTAVVRTQAVNQVVSVYGDIEADPAAALGVAAPRAVTITRVLVRPGQTVAAGQALIELAGSPESELAFRQAGDTVAFTQTDLARVERLFADKLATNDQVAAARKALSDAQASLASQQRQRGAGATQTLTAPRAAIVTKLAVDPGDHVAQDAALMTLASTDGLVAQLGLEPAERRVAAGQAVALKPAGGGATVAARISLVGRAPNPDNKLVTATAPLPGSTLAVGTAIQGDIIIGSHSALTVPRAAVVFDETGAHVFTVTGGKAHRVFVTAGADQGDDVEVTGPIKAGESVAVSGAYELQDGMAVRIAAPAPVKAKDE